MDSQEPFGLLWQINVRYCDTSAFYNWRSYKRYVLL